MCLNIEIMSENSYDFFSAANFQNRYGNTMSSGYNPAFIGNSTPPTADSAQVRAWWATAIVDAGGALGGSAAGAYWGAYFGPYGIAAGGILGGILGAASASLAYPTPPVGYPPLEKNWNTNNITNDYSSVGYMHNLIINKYISTGWRKDINKIIEFVSGEATNMTKIPLNYVSISGIKDIVIRILEVSKTQGVLNCSVNGIYGSIASKDTANKLIGILMDLNNTQDIWTFNKMIENTEKVLFNDMGILERDMVLSKIYLSVLKHSANYWFHYSNNPNHYRK